MIAFSERVVIGGKGKLKRVNLNKIKFEEDIVLSNEEAFDVISLMINDDVMICGSDKGKLYVCNKEERDSVMVDNVKRINYVIRIDSETFITITDEIKVWKYNL